MGPEPPLMGGIVISKVHRRPVSSRYSRGWSCRRSSRQDPHPRCTGCPGNRKPMQWGYLTDRPFSPPTGRDRWWFSLNDLGPGAVEVVGISNKQVAGSIQGERGRGGGRHKCDGSGRDRSQRSRPKTPGSNKPSRPECQRRRPSCSGRRWRAPVRGCWRLIAVALASTGINDFYSGKGCLVGRLGAQNRFARAVCLDGRDTVPGKGRVAIVGFVATVGVVGANGLATFSAHSGVVSDRTVRVAGIHEQIGAHVSLGDYLKSPQVRRRVEFKVEENIQTSLPTNTLPMKTALVDRWMTAPS